VEELTELSHHSLVRYQLPGTAELIPLLDIAPSKTDIERMLVISPSSPSPGRRRRPDPRPGRRCLPGDGYDPLEYVWSPPSPLLQHRTGTEDRPWAVMVASSQEAFSP
jgi:hypothetical protein